MASHLTVQWIVSINDQEVDLVGVFKNAYQVISHKNPARIGSYVDRTIMLVLFVYCVSIPLKK